MCSMSTAKNNPSKLKKLSSYMKAPVGILIKARQFYITSMFQLNDRVGFAFMACPTFPNINPLPRNFDAGLANPNNNSSSGGDDDYRELVRAASARVFRGSDYLGQQLHQKPTINNVEKVPRGGGVGILTIDEDKSCDFGDDIKVFKAEQAVFPSTALNI